MKYALLTPIKDLITPELAEEILEISKYPERLHQTTYWADNYFDSPACEQYSDKNADPAIQEKYRKTYGKGQGTGFFLIAHVPEDLEKRLFARLPENIRNMERPPYVRMQILKNSVIIPHTDQQRSLGLITTVTANPKIETVFYDLVKPHDFYREQLPDLDLIAKKCSIRFDKGETWLIDTATIHGTAGIDENVRVTINFMWSRKDMSELIPLLFKQ